MNIDWKVILIAILVALSWIVATVYYPQMPNSNKGFEAFEQSKQEVLVIVFEVEYEKAVAKVWQEFDKERFYIAEEYFDKGRKAWLFRIKARE